MRRARNFTALLGGLTCVAVLVAGVAMPANAAPIFTNGGFESNTGAATGWTEIAPFFGVQTWTGVGGVAAAEGANALWMGHTDTGGASHLIQSVSGFTIGDSYTLNFEMQAENGALDGRPGSFLGLALTGSSVPSASFSVIYPGSSPFFGGAWETQALTFTATSTSVLFDFNGLDPVGGSWESGLDDFRLTAVPEPTTVALAGLGLLGIGCLRRKRM
jgi:hypothetical protein